VLSAVVQFARVPQYVRALAARERDAVLLETARCDAENHHSYLFLSPVETLAANALTDLPHMFEQIEAELKAGLHVAGFVSYEAGQHFALERSASRGDAEELPLAWFGVYAKPFVFDHAAGAFVGDAPQGADVEIELPRRAVSSEQEIRLGIAEREYVAGIERIKEYIAAGDTYQVNFTDAVTVALEHDAAATFGALVEAQPVSYAALLSVAGRQMLSLSPELFFRVEAGDGARRIVTRPMKGTMRRGLDAADDAVQAALLRADEKNLSEHVMIVDLLRNDLGRVCEMGSVRVDDLFTVERYRTLLQMTSTVSGRLREGVGWYEVFGALFPSGSITGAPKIRTMEIIKELERGLRGVYTGAIGYIAPTGEAKFNVAIRTLVVKDGTARMGVGGGVVADSEAEAEYRECELKASFLKAERQEFSLIETMLADAGEVRLLPLHMERLAASAVYFGFACDRDAVEAAIRGRLRALDRERYRLRLLLDCDGAVTLTQTLLGDQAAEVAVCVSEQRVESHDLYLRHKTTRRALYEREFAAARAAGYDDVLFLNERGEVAEGAISTVFVRRDGRLATPPLSAGVLPGVLRRSLLEGDDGAMEETLTLDDLRDAEAVYIGNAVRGLRLVTRIDGVGVRALSASLERSSA
jgi:para-aminobenzoate synthetase/4-amino-4-deoxychorismate lyase